MASDRLIQARIRKLESLGYDVVDARGWESIFRNYGNYYRISLKGGRTAIRDLGDYKVVAALYTNQDPWVRSGKSTS